MRGTIYKLITGVLAILLASPLIWAARITDIKNDQSIKNVALYFGTFSPFHLGHEHIVENLLSIEQFDAVIIVPNYYTFHKPFTLKWTKRLELLEARYYEHPRVFLPLEKVIKPPEIVDFLRSDVPQKLNISYVAGQDVIEDWRARFWVNHFLINTADEILIVGDNNSTPKQASELFSTPVRFTSWGNSPIRGSDIRKEMETKGVSENLRKWIHPRVLQRMLSLNLYQAHSKLLSDTDLIQLKKRLISEFKQAVKPSIDQTLQSKNTKILWSDALIEKSIWVNIEDFTEFTDLQWSLYQKLEDRERISFSEFSKVFFAPSIVTYYKDLSLQLKELKPTQYQAIHENYFRNHISLIHRIANYLRSFKDALINFENIKLENSKVPLANNESSRILRLYRGYKIPTGLSKEEFIDALMTQGSLSQTAREHMKEGLSYEEAIYASDQYLKSEGETELVINHVLGTWRKSSSLVSATTDRDLAKSFAGEGGLLIEIQTTEDRVIHMNEHTYWKNSPFSKKGNPRFLQAEIAIKNLILPHEITNIQEVKDLVVARSNYHIRNWQFETSLKALLWTNYLKMKQSKPIQFCRRILK